MFILTFFLQLNISFGPLSILEQAKKDISTVEDPFDSPTYNIPEKPVSFTEGASYSLIILAGLGVAAAAAYAVFKELIFEPKEYDQVDILTKLKMVLTFEDFNI